MAKGHALIFAFFLVSGFSTMVAQQKEVLIDEEMPIMEADKQVEYVNDHIGMPNKPCHMEYQVMKKVVGTCMRLGRNARGCVAGNYLDLVHPECM